MKTLILVNVLQLKLFSKNPAVLILLIFAPITLIFVLGQALDNVFKQTAGMPSAIDYFGLTILSMAVMLGSFFASWGIQKERKENTILRLRVSPINPVTCVLGIFTASFFILAGICLVILFLLNLVFSVNIGNRPVITIIILVVQCFFSAALGTFFAVLISDDKACNGLINTFIPLLVFLGGGYFPIPEKGFLHDISVISPVRWVNLALTAEVREHSGTYTGAAILVCLSLSLLFIFGILIKTGKRGLK